MGAVREVAELRLPHHQRVRAFEGIAVLKGHDRILGKGGVVDPQLCLVFRQMIEGRPLCAGLMVVGNRVPLDEGSAAHVLPGHAHGNPFDEERAECGDLSHAPIDVSGAHHLRPALVELGDLRVRREAVGDLKVGVADPGQDLAGGPAGPADHRPRVFLLGCGNLEAFVDAGLAGRRLGLGGLDLPEGVVEGHPVVLFEGLCLLGCHLASADERLLVQLAGRPLRIDQGVHDRLGHRRIVAFVVPAASIADDVDDCVFREGLAILVRERGRAHDRLRVVAVDVEDRYLQALRHVARVVRGAPGMGGGCESDLVVDDDVNGSAGAVAAKLRKIENLRDDALAGECGVAVDENRQDGEAPVSPVLEVLARADDALQNAVRRFEVRRVRREIDAGRLACRGGVRPLGSQMVLDVARALDGALVDESVEFSEDLLVLLSRDVRQDVEPSPVGHRDRNRIEAVVGGAGKYGVKRGNERFPAFEREALLPEVLGVQEGLERLRLIELLENLKALVVGELGARAFDSLLEPAALLRIRDVHVLEADRRAVCLSQQRKRIAQGHRAVVREIPGGKGAV